MRVPNSDAIFVLQQTTNRECVMKKSVIVNGTHRQVEFEYRETDKLISCQVCKRYDRRWGWLQVRTSYHEAVAIIDGVEYPGVRRWHCEGGRYSEQYGYNGHFYSSQKKMIERILELAESTPEKRPA